MKNVIVITGASSGIGALAARALARAGHTVYATCTAKMGRDEMSVVDGKLKVYGVQNLRVADGSILPRITTGNTMAPCVVIGERAAEALKASHKLSPLGGSTSALFKNSRSDR